MKSTILAIVIICITLPGTAKADTLVEPSIGFGLELSPNLGDIQDPSLMLSVGWPLLDAFQVQLGFAAAYPRNGDVLPGRQFQVRPMLVLIPPSLPFFLRAVFAITAPFSTDREVGYGGSIGWHFGIFNIRFFAEIGILPVNVNTTMHWLFETRTGAVFRF